MQLFELLQRGTAGWPAEIEAARLWYEPHLERLHEDAGVRASDLLQLVRIAAGFASRTSFLTELTLDPPQATSDLAGCAAAGDAAFSSRIRLSTYFPEVVPPAGFTFTGQGNVPVHQPPTPNGADGP